MGRTLIAIAATVALVSAPAGAQALCLSTDIAGGWFTYTIGASDFGTSITRCSLQFDFLGNVQSNSWCWDADAVRRGGLTGQVFVRLGCLVTGTISGPHIGFNVIEGSLTASKEAATGLGVTDEPGVFLFTMTRG